MDEGNERWYVDVELEYRRAILIDHRIKTLSRTFRIAARKTGILFGYKRVYGQENIISGLQHEVYIYEPASCDDDKLLYTIGKADRSNAPPPSYLHFEIFTTITPKNSVLPNYRLLFIQKFLLFVNYYWKAIASCPKMMMNSRVPQVSKLMNGSAAYTIQKDSIKSSLWLAGLQMNLPLIQIRLYLLCRAHDVCHQTWRYPSDQVLLGTGSTRWLYDREMCHLRVRWVEEGGNPGTPVSSWVGCKPNYASRSTRLCVLLIFCSHPVWIY